MDDPDEDSDALRLPTLEEALVVAEDEGRLAEAGAAGILLAKRQTMLGYTLGVWVFFFALCQLFLTAHEGIWTLAVLLQPIQPVQASLPAP